MVAHCSLGHGARLNTRGFAASLCDLAELLAERPEDMETVQETESALSHDCCLIAAATQSKGVVLIVWRSRRQVLIGMTNALELRHLLPSLLHQAAGTIEPPKGSNN